MDPAPAALAKTAPAFAIFNSVRSTHNIAANVLLAVPNPINNKPVTIFNSPVNFKTK